MRADRADDAGLGHLAGQHAGEIGAVMVPGAEDAEIVARCFAARTQHEGGFRIVGSNLAGFPLDGIGLADDQRVALFGIFAHSARIVSARNAFGEDIVDHAVSEAACLQRLVQTGIPGIFHRRGMDAGNFEVFPAQSLGAKAVTPSAMPEASTMRREIVI